MVVVGRGWVVVVDSLLHSLLYRLREMNGGSSGGSGGAGDGGDDGSPPQTRAVYESLHTQEPYMNPAYEQEPYMNKSRI